MHLVIVTIYKLFGDLILDQLSSYLAIIVSQLEN